MRLNVDFNEIDSFITTNFNEVDSFIATNFNEVFLINAGGECDCDETIQAQISEAITAALKVNGVDKYALASELAALIGRVSTTENAIDGLQVVLDTKVNDADLKIIAKSGNIKDLIQTADDYIVFNCGTANTVI